MRLFTGRGTKVINQSPGDKRDGQVSSSHSHFFVTSDPVNYLSTGRMIMISFRWGRMDVGKREVGKKMCGRRRETGRMLRREDGD